MEHRFTRLRETTPRFTSHSILQRFHRYRIFPRLRQWNHRNLLPRRFTRPRRPQTLPRVPRIQSKQGGLTVSRVGSFLSGAPFSLNPPASLSSFLPVL